MIVTEQYKKSFTANNTPSVALSLFPYARTSPLKENLRAHLLQRHTEITKVHNVPSAHEQNEFEL